MDRTIAWMTLTAALALGPLPAQSQSQAAAGAGWGMDTNMLSGAAAALGGLFGFGTPASAQGAGTANPGAATGPDGASAAAPTLGSVDWGKAAAAVGITGFGTPAAAPAGPDAGTGAAPAGYLQQLVQGLVGATPDQRAAFLSGVTTELPKLAGEVTTWWNALPKPEKDQYLAQISQMLAYLAQMAGFAPPQTPAR